MISVTDSPIKNQPYGISFNRLMSDEKGKNDLLKKCMAVDNSSGIFLSRNDLEAKNSDIIKGFFRKSIAAQSYGKMFSTGERFKKLGIALAPSTTRKFSFSSLEHLDTLSNSYLNKVKEKTKNLTPQEKKLVDKIVATNLHFRHQSNVQLVTSNNVLNIMSLDKLNSQGYLAGGNTKLADVKQLGNHDFVFFGVEFSDDKSQLPLNTKHGISDFGAYAYITDDYFPYGYFTLTDHLYNELILYLGDLGYKDFSIPFTEMRNERIRIVRGDKGIYDVPIYNAKDMKLALGLHLVDFLRSSKDIGFKAFALDENLDSKQLDGILNYIFHPEFHVPRIVSTTNFTKVKLRDVTMEEAVKAHSIEELLPYIKNKNDACAVMSCVIDKAKPDIAEYLFSKFDFTKEDTIKMSENSYSTLAFNLVHQFADEKILKMFLERGLVDPNEPIRFGCCDTMLDNPYTDNKKIIDVLLSFGAVSGLKSNNSEYLLSVSK